MTPDPAVIASPSQAGDWTDGKRYWWLLSPALPLIGLVSVFGAIAGAPTLLLWLLPVVFYGVVPFLDWFIGEDRVNAPESAVPGLDQDAWYRRIVYLYIPTQYLLTVVGAWYAVQGDLAWWELAGLALTVGMINGVGINTAHELGHKTNGLERWLAKITLAPVAYGHFFIEHNKGHHKNVATPEDPASSNGDRAAVDRAIDDVTGEAALVYSPARGPQAHPGGRGPDGDAAPVSHSRLSDLA